MNKKGLIFSTDVCIAAIFLIIATMLVLNSTATLLLEWKTQSLQFKQKQEVIFIADFLVKLPEKEGLAVFDVDKGLVLENEILTGKMPEYKVPYWVEIRKNNGQIIEIKKCKKAFLAVERFVQHNGEKVILRIGICE